MSTNENNAFQLADDDDEEQPIEVVREATADSFLRKSNEIEEERKAILAQAEQEAEKEEDAAVEQDQLM